MPDPAYEGPIHEYAGPPSTRSADENYMGRSNIVPMTHEDAGRPAEYRNAFAEPAAAAAYRDKHGDRYNSQWESAELQAQYPFHPPNPSGRLPSGKIA